jgi:hypothetical protein
MTTTQTQAEIDIIELVVLGPGCSICQELIDLLSL